MINRCDLIPLIGKTISVKTNGAYTYVAVVVDDVGEKYLHYHSPGPGGTKTMLLTSIQQVAWIEEIPHTIPKEATSVGAGDDTPR